MIQTNKSIRFKALHECNNFEKWKMYQNYTNEGREAVNEARSKAFEVFYEDFSTK